MRALLACGVILASALALWQAGCGTDSDKSPEAAVLRRLPPLDASKLDPNYHEDWKYEEFSDENRGIFVRAVHLRKDEKPRDFCRNGGFVTESGIIWVKDFRILPQGMVTVKVRLTPDTITYLIATPQAPLVARHVALQDISKVEGLSQCEQLKLIESASRDVSAEMRLMAVYKAGEYTPVSKAIPVLCRSLCDPCGVVAEAAIRPLISYFFPSDDKGEVALYDFTYVPQGDGGADEFDRYQRDFAAELDRTRHRDALDVARRIHKLKPDLVTEEDLATIEALSKGLVEEPEAKSDAQSQAKPQEQPDAKSPKAAPATT